MIPISPTNQQDYGDPVSSNLVVWQGSDIPCLKICKGDSISDITAKAAYQLCAIWEQLGMDPATATFLPVDGGGFTIPDTCFSCPTPQNFHDLVQAIITQLCAIPLPGSAPPVVAPGTDCPDCLINIASCFLPDFIDNQGNQLTQVPIAQYAFYLGSKLCEIITDNHLINNTLSQHTIQITGLTNSVIELQNQPPAPQLPVFLTTCLTDQIPVVPINGITLQNMILAIETAFCNLRTATGMPNDLIAAIFKQCTNLDTSPSMNLPGVNMGSLPGWRLQSQYSTLADSINNMWLTICDLRAGMNTIFDTCCSQGCDSIILSLQTTLTGTTINFFWTGNVGAFQDCSSSGSQVTITDAYGNSYTTRIPIAAYIGGTFSLNVGTTPLNLGTNLNINVEACLVNAANHTTCERCIETNIFNAAPCPPVLASADSGTIAYNFSNTLTGNTDFTVTLRLHSDQSTVDTQTFAATGPGTISGIFTGLMSGTIYEIILTISRGTQSNTCPPIIVTTAGTTCQAPTQVSAGPVPN